MLSVTSSDLNSTALLQEEQIFRTLMIKYLYAEKYEIAP